MNGVSMTPHMKWGIAGIVVALILLATPIPWWVVFALVVVAIAIPTTAWLMLDESQRRRYREIRRRQRGQIR
jgi:cell division protein FtsW (lipid II flippase)